MDLQKIKDLKDLQAILDLMKRNDLAELEIEEEGRRLRLRKAEPRLAAEGVVFRQETNGATESAATVSAAPVESEAHEDQLFVVNSPLVGTFYRASSPEADPFAQEGDRVDEDTVLCIVEAMKVMNEIRAGVSGIVREILVKNGEPVEFGQPLFRVETE
jgi:acetyl-CoA carboxylase biotin carboxyl carrier protein